MGAARDTRPGAKARPPASAAPARKLGARRRRQATGGAPAFEIWQAGTSVLSIDSPVRLRILHALEEAPATLGQLVRLTRKAKSTVSAQHLAPLVRSGLVAEATDPHDARVKWFRLQGARLGSSAVAAGELREAVIGFVQRRGLLPPGPLLDVIDLPALARHAEPAYAKGVAQRLGEALARLADGAPVEAALQRFNEELARRGLGCVAMEGGRPASDHADARVRRLLETVARASLGTAR